MVTTATVAHEGQTRRDFVLKPKTMTAIWKSKVNTILTYCTSCRERVKRDEKNKTR